MMRQFLVFVLLFVGGSVSLQAQSRSLDYYLSNAIDNSPAIAEQRNNADAARLQKDLIYADLSLPVVTATADYMYAPYSNHWGYDPAITDGGHYSALLNVDYPIFTANRKQVREKVSSIDIRQSEYQIASIKHELQQSVTNQYITVYQDHLKLQYLQQIYDLLNKQKEVLQSLAKQGITNILDLKQLDIELQSNHIAQKQAESTYQKDLLQLNEQCGNTDSTTNVSLRRPVIPVDSLHGKQSRFMQRFSLDSLQVAAQQSTSELKYQPDISLYGNTGLNAVKFTGIQDHFGYSVGMQVSIPLYDGHQKQISRHQSRLHQRSIEAYQQRFKTRRQLQRTSLRTQLEKARDQLDIIQQQVSQYQSLLDDYQKALSQGVYSVMDYLTVLRNYADVQQQRIETLGNQWRIQNELNYWNW